MDDGEHPGDREDRQWAGRIAGVFFLVLGAVVLLGPLLGFLRDGTRAVFGLLGSPMMVRGTPSVLWSVLEGGLMVAVGLGVLADRRWAFFLAMLFVLRLMFLGGAGWWVLGALLMLWLAKGLPPVGGAVPHERA